MNRYPLPPFFRLPESMTTVPKLLSLQCNVCKKKCGKISRCAACHAVTYCSKEHQTADRPAHKSICKMIKQARSLAESFETELRIHPGHVTMTRYHMQARLNTVVALQLIRTKEAIQAACYHAKDLQRLNRGDSVGVRSLIPSLMLRLGKDQEAYDYMKWYATTGNRSDYDWGDMDLPFLDLQGEDAFEPLSVGNWTHDHGPGRLSHKVYMTLLKLRLLLDLYSLQNSMQGITEKFPQELVDNVRESLVSDIVASNTNIMQDVRNGVSIEPYIDNIKAQTNTMFDAVRSAENQFWKTLVRRAQYQSNTSSEACRVPYPEEMELMPKDVEEVHVVLDRARVAWEETPGAIGWVEAKLGA